MRCLSRSKPSLGRPQIFIALVGLLTCLVASTASLADPGDLLTSFGTGGIAYEGAQTFDVVKDAILHPDHGLLLAIEHRTDGGDYQIRLTQMDSATGVVLSTQIFPPFIEGLEVHLEDDGMGGVIVGATVDGDLDIDDKDVLVFRLDGGLAVDSGFGYRQVGLNLASSTFDVLEDLEVLSDGRIVAAQYTFIDSELAAGLIFLNADGSLDDSLPNGGLELLPNPLEGGLSPIAMAADSQDRLWIGAFYSGPSPGQMAVVRVLPDATLDTTFATSGASTIDFRDCPTCPADPSAYLEDIEVLQDRGYVLVSVDNPVFNESEDEGAVTRITESGDADPSFGGWHRISFVTPSGSTSPGSPMPLYRLDLEVDPALRGLVMAARADGPATDPDYLGLARVGTDGAFDTGFGDGGKVVHSFGPNSLIAQPHLMIEGFNDITGSTSSLRIAVLESGVTLDTAVMAIEGFGPEVFADGFESGGVSAWSVVVP